MYGVTKSDVQNQLKLSDEALDPDSDREEAIYSHHISGAEVWVEGELKTRNLTSTFTSIPNLIKWATIYKACATLLMRNPSESSTERIGDVTFTDRGSDVDAAVNAYNFQAEDCILKYVASPSVGQKYPRMQTHNPYGELITTDSERFG